MNETARDDRIRATARKLLEDKGFVVTNAASGPGVPKFSRVEIEKNGKVTICSIKTTHGGRISYTRNSDGSYKVLSQSDAVIHAYLVPNSGGKVRISMFPAAVVVKAFEANHQAKITHGMEHIPSWVNPENEPGWRLTGSGFQGKALWSETVPLVPVNQVDVASSLIVEPAEASGQKQLDSEGIMDHIKGLISKHMGVEKSGIEIDIRVKH